MPESNPTLPFEEDQKTALAMLKVEMKTGKARQKSISVADLKTLLSTLSVAVQKHTGVDESNSLSGVFGTARI